MYQVLIPAVFNGGIFEVRNWRFDIGEFRLFKQTIYELHVVEFDMFEGHIDEIAISIPNILNSGIEYCSSIIYVWYMPFDLTEVSVVEFFDHRRGERRDSHVEESH